ncbi:hypothetical protein N7468_005867 [Penicillium chermesinum]|uniref:Actin cortical patch SUR7/pH-response regulator PalI n=1 Tax=Penicillium chermesinum TaxID=63820 RepID=A0A9W9TNC8_9EURO|nr:uncharacterized protein N7468_005867 [Penicillium chermesinum]KAJ5232911.1 hypothetical protein N7468_005867 [Penicillium chermesinum]KAJ6172562.1 hypothetical protein N7470_001629 [Penicillium chermesinum]
MQKPDPKTLFPTVTAFIAFILTLMCLFAGTETGLMDDVHLLTLYTPEGTSTSSNSHSFYSIHVMSYCQGTIGSAEPDSGAVRNVTECSDRQVLFSFDPTKDWSDNITHGPTLEWPRVITDDFHAFRLTMQSIAILYCIGVSAMGAVLLTRVAALIAPRPQQGLFEFGFMVLGSLVLSIASIITTVIAFEFVALINAHGEGSDVSASYGEKFLGMTWAATALLLAGSLSSFINVFVRGLPLAEERVPKDEEEEG